MNQTKQQKIEAYINFLLSKIKVADKAGIKISPGCLHPSTLPHQSLIIEWALQLGRALIAPDCGMGKSHMAIEIGRILTGLFDGKALIVTELGVKETFCDADPEVGEGARLGINIEYVTNDIEAMASDCSIICTNYERVRMGSFDFSKYTVVLLDEGNYIKNMAGETTDALSRELKKVKYKYIFSATPAPNETLELINYAHILGIADRGQILTQFFQRNSTKAGELTLHEQHEADFWLWAHSWMCAIELPSDLGFSDEGFELPELHLHWHEVTMDKAIDAGIDKDGQAKLFLDTGNSLPDNAKIKRLSIDVRLNAAMEIINQQPDEHWIIWHNLEDERRAIEKEFKGKKYQSLYGAQKWEDREKIIIDYTKGNLQNLGTKGEISSVGCNFQKHSHLAVQIGVDNDWDKMYQQMKRQHRYKQGHACHYHIFYLPEEYAIVQNLKRKQKLQKEQRSWLRNLTKKYGLGSDKMIDERRRSIKENRKVYSGENYKLVNTDCTLEWIEHVEDNSIDLINTSFPFGNHYEYTNYYNDYGHNTDNKQYAKQLDYLLPELFRSMKPGRIVAVHLKNRIHYGSVTGLGFSIFHRFTHLVCDAMEKHGFYTMGFHYIPTCVVGENNQTYRLTYGEMQKDSTKMGSGIPEEIWLFRKPPTSTANAYADETVRHNHAKCNFCGYQDLTQSFIINNTTLYKCPSCTKFLAEGELHIPENYNLAQWQIDADSFWQSSGNGLITPDEIRKFDLKRIRKWWNVFNPSHIYDFDNHVKLLQDLDEAGKLSRTFTTLPLRSGMPYIWNDVNRMQGLNLEQSKRKERNHICPQPTDEANRIIELYSNIGDLVADPFGGLGTTPLQAMRKGRIAFATELSDIYAAHANFYLQQQEKKRPVPTLFDTLNTAV